MLIVIIFFFFFFFFPWCFPSNPPPPKQKKNSTSVLYSDIDVHHGDGVEEAFLTTDRVLTVSFHKYGNGFFPGTGSLHNVGVGAGKGFSLNAPLRDGITDEGYESVFAPVMDACVSRFDPGAIVLQCGADSLAGDRLGRLNLTSSGHAAAVARVAAYGRPTLVLGGGGYKVANVARCWANETGRLVGEELDDEVPEHEYSEFYAPGGNKLRVPVSFFSIFLFCFSPARFFFFCSPFLFLFPPSSFSRPPNNIKSTNHTTTSPAPISRTPTAKSTSTT